MKVNITIKSLLVVLLVALTIMALVGFLRGFLCATGLFTRAGYYIVILAILALLSWSRSAKLQRFWLDTLILLQLLYMLGVPVTALMDANKYGGFEFFLSDRLTTYLFQEGTALLILILSSLFYAKERGLYRGKLISNLLSPLSIALVVRICWLIGFETRHLERFAATAPHLKVEYVVLASIPLFLAVLILTIGRILGGYVLGFFLGLAHVILVLLMVVMGQNPGGGPIVVSLSSLAICIFSVKGVMAYYFNNNLALPGFAQVIMRTVLRIRRNPKKNKKMLELGGVKKGATVLDYGCGLGNYSIEAAKIVGESGTVIAADISANMLQGLEKHISASGLSNVSPVLINSTEDIEASNFDFILLIDVLHLIKDKIATVDLLLGKLGGNGRLLVKFEHFGREQVKAVLDNCAASGRRLVHKDYWLLSK